MQIMHDSSTYSIHLTGQQTDMVDIYVPEIDATLTFLADEWWWSPCNTVFYFRLDNPPSIKIEQRIDRIRNELTYILG